MQLRLTTVFLGKAIFIAAILFIAGLLLFVVSNRLINDQSVHTYNSTDEIPANKVGLLLGTSKYAVKGGVNLYYKYRIDAAVELFRSGKIKYILISGDNSTKAYNEPQTMKDDLIASGIPSSQIYLDFAGFRTLDSVVRCKTIFGQTKVTIISQPFHNERAIYLASKNGIEAIGYNAKEVTASYGWKTRIRERIARVKMLFDLWFSVEPKFGGDKIVIE